MHKVVIETCESKCYPSKETLFRPSIRYPEYPQEWPVTDEKENDVYDCVRNALIRMGLDADHYGTPQWNPLKEIIAEGDTVLLKPNFVTHANGSGDTVECLYTQPGVIAAVVDYVCKALNGTGKIIVGDAPMQDCEFERLQRESGLDKLIEFYKLKNINLELVDFRGVVTTQSNGVVHYMENENAGKEVDLSQNSEFASLSEEENLRLRKGGNDPSDLHQHHNVNKHEYEICNELLQADVIIDMPKPKLHMKAGVTIALKNMVGANVRKEYLPHHMEGDKQTGTGDAYEKRSLVKRLRAKARDKAYVLAIQKKYRMAFLFTQIRRACALITKTYKDKLTQGTWHGNETISKTIVDLNKIVLYADKNGVLRDTPQRKRFIVADMIISGELEGPLSPTAKPIGVIALGDDAVCFDEVIATLMGAKVEEIPTLRTARKQTGKYPLTEKNSTAVILSNNKEWDGKLRDEISKESLWYFRPIESWKKAFYIKQDEIK